MSSTPKRLHSFIYRLSTIVILAALLAVPAAAPVYGQSSVPAECRDDQGNAVVPAAPSTGFTWVILLNFNHAPSSTASKGCLAIRTAGSQTPQYKTLTCPIQNNTQNVTVGSGSATFRGAMNILCAPDTGWSAATQTDFFIQARAAFAAPGSYPLVTHRNAAFQAAVDSDWRVTLASRYGQASFSSRDPNNALPGKTLRLRSEVVRKEGIHTIESTVLRPAGTIGTFPFDLAEPFVVGSAGLTLNELIIDPTGSCCRM